MNLELKADNFTRFIKSFPELDNLKINDLINTSYQSNSFEGSLNSAIKAKKANESISEEEFFSYKDSFAKEISEEEKYKSNIHLKHEIHKMKQNQNQAKKHKKEKTDKGNNINLLDKSTPNNNKEVKESHKPHKTIVSEKKINFPEIFKKQTPEKLKENLKKANLPQELLDILKKLAENNEKSPESNHKKVKENDKKSVTIQKKDFLKVFKKQTPEKLKENLKKDEIPKEILEILNKLAQSDYSLSKENKQQIDDKSITKLKQILEHLIEHKKINSKELHTFKKDDKFDKFIDTKKAKKTGDNLNRLSKIMKDYDISDIEIKTDKKIIQNMKSSSIKFPVIHKEEIIKDQIKNPKDIEDVNFIKKLEKVVDTHKIEVIETKDNKKSNDNKESLAKENFTFSKSESDVKLFKNSKLSEAQTPKFEKVDMQKIIDQIKKSIKPPLKNEITIQLKPEHLGKIKIMLVMENNSLKGNITAEHHDVQHTIMNNMQQLETALKEKGINLSNFTVTVENQNELDKKDNSQDFQNKSKKRKTVSFESKEDDFEMNYETNEIKENTNLNIKI